MRLTFIGIFLLITQAASAQHYAYNKFDSLLHNYYAQNQFNGSAIIIQNNERVLLDSYGFTSAEKNDALSNESVFLGPSLNQVIIGLELTKLVYKEKLDLQHSVSYYLPTLTDTLFKQLKIWHLAYNCSGLPTNKSFYKKLLKSTNELLEHNQFIEYLSVQKNLKLTFEPGSKIEENSLNSILLGAIIEEITGHPIGTYFWANYFGPLGMRKAYVYKSNLFNEEKLITEAFNSKSKAIKPSKFSSIQLFQQIFIAPYELELLVNSIMNNGIIEQNLNYLFLKPVSVPIGSTQKISLGGFTVVNDYEVYELRSTIEGFNLFLHYNQKQGDFLILIANAYSEKFDEVKRVLLNELAN